LFSTPMVQAILEGRKSQTRRIIKKQPHGAGEWIMQGISWLFPNVNPYVNIKCPYGQPGTILWVRETWNVIPVEQKETGDILGVERRVIHSINPRSGAIIPYFYLYKASSDFYEIDHREWKPSIFMPREACRIRLLVKDVRVERLQDITEEDAIAEGIEREGDGFKAYQKIHSGPHKGESHPWNCIPNGHARTSYQDLWESINGEGSWEKNPYVWVIKFKRINK
ncbi:MAG: hypothetical protein LLG05_15250, partial [Porphyromonadaceae bacterium]|nr:hypothetical protein [Porphyromonadaceae bacterium]